MSSKFTFTVHEARVTPKAPGRVSEDGLVITDHFAAVIDGATTPHAVGADGRTSGKIAMDALTDAVTHLDPDATLEEFLTAAATTIAAHARAADLPPDLPTAVAVIYSAHRNELWSVGDARWAINGVHGPIGRRDVDTVAAAARATILQGQLLRGATVADLRANDVGRAGTVAIRDAKLAFRNNVNAGPLAFAALTGTPVPVQLTETLTVPAGADVVLASDGYLTAAATLLDAETDLAAALAQDPLCMSVIAATKCPASDSGSFDDRTYLRLTARC